MCDYKTNDRSNFHHHKDTKKHIRNTTAKTATETTTESTTENIIKEMQNKINNLEKENIELKEEIDDIHDHISNLINRYSKICVQLEDLKIKK